MQNRGFIRIFTVCLVLAALYSLSFTYFTIKANRNADTYATEKAGGDNIAYATYQKQYLDSLSRVEDYYNFFWLRKFSLNDCRQHQLNLGLDLKGWYERNTSNFHSRSYQKTCHRMAMQILC